MSCWLTRQMRKGRIGLFDIACVVLGVACMMAAQCVK